MLRYKQKNGHVSMCFTASCNEDVVVLKPAVTAITIKATEKLQSFQRRIPRVSIAFFTNMEKAYADKTESRRTQKT